MIKVFSDIGGSNTVWGSAQVLDVWLVEQRALTDRIAADRLARGTWALAISTIVLALATLVLIFVTLAKG